MPKTTKMPGVLGTIREGLDLTANHAQLLILPILMDLALLFGPRLRIYNLFERAVKAAFAQMRSGAGEAISGQLEQMSALMLEELKAINLLGAVQTFPIGVPMLLSGGTPAETPLGPARVIEITSVLPILALLALFMLIGLILGSLYFALVGQTAAEKKFRLTPSVFLHETLNVLLFSLGLTVFFALLLLPLSCLITAMTTMMPALYMIVLVLLVVIISWLVIPLFYTPHGIYTRQLNVVEAVKSSLLLGRWSMAPTGMFLIAVLILLLGLDLVWTIPPASSWLILIGIFGHAVIATALLASSFLLYQKFEHWQEENQEFLQWRKELFKSRRNSRRKNKGQEE